MNNPTLRWLLDLNTIPENAESVELSWTYPMPLWLWALLILGAAVLAMWSYRRLLGARAGRIVLAGVRSVLLVLVIVLIAGPMLEEPRETIEEDWVIVLIDRSASMSIEDAEPAPGLRMSRDAQLRRVLDDRAELFRTMDESRRLAWLGFHVGAYELQASQSREDEGATAPTGPPPAPVVLDEPDGQRTDLSAAIEQALQRAAARPISGVVVFSDGRLSDPLERSVLRRLQADAIQVFSVPLGSEDPLGDLAIGRIDAPRRAFIRDKVPVVVAIDRLGAAVRDIGATVRLVDTLTGTELDSEILEPGDERDELTLIAEPQLAGETTWEVVIDTPRDDLIPDNNVKTFGIDLIDRPLRVLFVDGYPRWEYQFLKWVLIREKSIESSIFLVSADRDFAQEGNQPITRLPRSPEEFAQFDVIVIGDVPSSFFSPEQLEMIRDQVADRGAGLLWIGGERYTPSTFPGTAMSELLPVRGSLDLSVVSEPINVRPTPLAGRLGVMQLIVNEQVGWPEELSDPSYGWSQLQWAQRIEPGQLKPTAEVLAETVAPVSGVHLPLVISMRFGAGQSMYVATDEIWRWRWGRGDALPEQFWVQLIRLLGRESLTESGQRAVLRVAPRRVAVNQPLRIELRLLDASLVDAQRETVRIVFDDETGAQVTEVELKRLPDEEGIFAATILPTVTGTLRARIDDTTLEGLELSSSVEVYTPDDELRRPETDHALLSTLADSTGGRVLKPDELDQLPGLLPNRSVTTPNPRTERIWDTPLFFILFLLLITGEWIGRKLIRLV